VDESPEKAVEEARKKVMNLGIIHKTPTALSAPKKGSNPPSPKYKGADFKTTGILKPGDTGYLAALIKGPPKSYQQAMQMIDKQLARKRMDKRQVAYDHEHAARLARVASDAVADMAQEVGAEAEENAQRVANEEEDCVQEMRSASGEDERRHKVKECKKKEADKKKAYAEVAQAESASNLAVKYAGDNEGKVRAEASLYADGTSAELAAQKAADLAKMKLKEFETETEVDNKIEAHRLEAKRVREQEVAAAKAKAQAAQEEYDAKQFSTEQADAKAFSAPRITLEPAKPFPSITPKAKPEAEPAKKVDVAKTTTDAEKAVQVALSVARKNPTPENAAAAEKALSAANKKVTSTRPGE